MTPLVVDTDVASYIFKWHSSAQNYTAALCGSELILSFMSVAEMRMGALSAGWGGRRRALLERFIEGFAVVYADDNLCTSWATLRAAARAAGRSLSPQDTWIAATHWGWTRCWLRTIEEILNISRSGDCSRCACVAFH